MRYTEGDSSVIFNVYLNRGLKYFDITVNPIKYRVAFDKR